MSNNQSIHARRQAAVPNGLASAFPIYVSKAKNTELWDEDGNRYLDFIGGISVLNTGHCHPKITEAAVKQAQTFSHTAANIAMYDIYVELAEKLNAAAPGDTPKKTAFFTTGAEALENAIKISRARTGRNGVITFTGGFHGRTLFTLGMTGKVAPYKSLFGPFPAGIYHAPFPHESLGVSEAEAVSALHKIFKADIEANQVAAIAIEPVQGEGGFYPVSPSFAQQLRNICDEHGIMLICDEVQTCFGRTGTLFATEQLGIEPDLLTAAKSLAGGYPLSAVIGKADVMDAPLPGGLGGTYGGNPVAIAAALAVLEVIQEENLLARSNQNLLARSNQLGEQFKQTLTEIQTKQGNNSIIANIRNKGAMIAFDIVDKAGQPDAAATKSLIDFCQANGLLIASCGLHANSIRIMMPLTATDENISEGLGTISKGLASLA